MDNIVIYVNNFVTIYTRMYVCSIKLHSMHALMFKFDSICTHVIYIPSVPVECVELLNSAHCISVCPNVLLESINLIEPIYYLKWRAIQLAIHLIVGEKID